MYIKDGIRPQSAWLDDQLSWLSHSSPHVPQWEPRMLCDSRKPNVRALAGEDSSIMWGGGREGNFRSPFIESSWSDSFNPLERLLEIMEPRPSFAVREIEVQREEGLACCVEASCGVAAPSRAQVSSQMPFLLWLQIFRLVLSCCFSKEPPSHPTAFSRLSWNSYFCM